METADHSPRRERVAHEHRHPRRLRQLLSEAGDHCPARPWSKPPPEDAIYPLNRAGDTGPPLDGANNYTIRFDLGTTPPVNKFWSITL
jgi:hypothetical protein